MTRDAIDPAIFKQVAHALDPEGRIRAWRSGSRAIVGLFAGLEAAKRLDETTARAHDLLRTATLANQLFSPRGWGVVNMPVPTLEAAIDAAETDLERADVILADAWTPDRVDRSISRMKHVYARMEPEGVSERRQGRWRLMREAQELHFDGRYSASVPLILANIEGFVADAEQGRLFFTSRESAQLSMIDPARLSGMVCALATLHAVYTKGVGETTPGSVLSRHGILHGRVLGYGTRVVSAQALTLFDAVADLLISPR